jgi:hypothetical protein
VADLFQEIDDELRQDKASRLWKLYGKYLIAAAIIIITSVGGYKFWQQKQLDDGEKASIAYEAALARSASGDFKGAIDQLNEKALGITPGYAALSQMQKANLAMKIKDFEAALITYKDIAENDDYPQSIKEWASFRHAAVRVEKQIDSNASADLDKLIATDSPWRFLAKEIKAIRETEIGNNSDAKAIFSELADDENAPERLRVRAAEFLQTLQ